MAKRAVTFGVEIAVDSDKAGSVPAGIRNNVEAVQKIANAPTRQLYLGTLSKTIVSYEDAQRRNAVHGIAEGPPGNTVTVYTAFSDGTRAVDKVVSLAARNAGMLFLNALDDTINRIATAAVPRRYDATFVSPRLRAQLAPAGITITPWAEGSDALLVTARDLEAALTQARPATPESYASLPKLAVLELAHGDASFWKSLAELVTHYTQVDKFTIAPLPMPDDVGSGARDTNLSAMNMVLNGAPREVSLSRVDPHFAAAALGIARSMYLAMLTREVTSELTMTVAPLLNLAAWSAFSALMLTAAAAAAAERASSLLRTCTIRIKTITWSMLQFARGEYGMEHPADYEPKHDVVRFSNGVVERNIGGFGMAPYWAFIIPPSDVKRGSARAINDNYGTFWAAVTTDYMRNKCVVAVKGGDAASPQGVECFSEDLEARLRWDEGKNVTVLKLYAGTWRDDARIAALRRYAVETPQLQLLHLITQSAEECDRVAKGVCYGEFALPTGAAAPPPLWEARQAHSPNSEFLTFVATWVRHYDERDRVVPASIFSWEEAHRKALDFYCRRDNIRARVAAAAARVLRGDATW